MAVYRSAEAPQRRGEGEPPLLLNTSLPNFYSDMLLVEASNSKFQNICLDYLSNKHT
jgi:hypothetical protein